MTTPIEEIAQRLMREGYVDNEADARLAAVRIILASEQRGSSTTETCGSLEVQTS